MKILGLSLGETSTAAVLVDGRIVACASEERFTRRKNDESFPRHAIEYCLNEAGVSGSALDQVAIATVSADLSHILAHYYSRFSISDHIEEQHKYWYPTLYEGQQIAWHELYRDRWDLDQYPGGWNELIASLSGNYYPTEGDRQKINQFLIEAIHRQIGVRKDRIGFFDHHTAHAAYAYWASPLRGDGTVVLTMDAEGDGLSATVSIPQEGGLKRLKAVGHRDFRLARMYRYVTLLMGMKPNEHEYKVMGLAPYAKPKIYEKALQVFRNTMYVDGLDFKYHDNPKDMYFYFKDKLEGIRFDGIAGGLQKYTEEIITTWVRNVLRETKANKISFSGGVAMNIKAMQCLAELPEVTSIFIPPSGSDESLAIGACYHVCQALYGAAPDALPDVYLGPTVAMDEVRRLLRDLRAAHEPFSITEDATPGQIARLLAHGRVVGRCSGRMEFGARSLGNRSILADPRSPQIVQNINEKIKNRDFWMPFAPAILKEDANRYICNPKKLPAPYMTIAFDTTPIGAQEIIAATHPADHTARPQLVDSQSNPEFAELIQAFKNETGVGALLNTSFNLHGEPVVRTASDALRVFRLSGIDDLVIGDALISKS